MCRVFAVSGLNRLSAFPSKILLHPKGQLQRLLLTTFHHLLPQFALMLHTLLPFSGSGTELIIYFLVPRLQNEIKKDAIGIWKGAGVIIVTDAQKLGFLLSLLSIFVAVKDEV